MSTLRRIALSLAIFSLLAPAVALANHDLIISEYIEGTSNNKGLEIYNPTAAPINLSGCSIQIYSNGAGTPTTTIALPAVSLAVNDVFVVAHSLATFAGSADLATASLNFNGDDAVTLVRGLATLDVIGQIGFSPPGAGWGTAPLSTLNSTIRRGTAFCDGDTNGGDAFSPAGEWNGFSTDTFDGLGTHAAACRQVPGAAPWSAAVMASMLVAGAVVALRRREGATRA